MPQATSQTNTDPGSGSGLCSGCGHGEYQHRHVRPVEVEGQGHSFRLDYCKLCGCEAWVGKEIEDPLANNPRAQIIRQLVKEKGVVSMGDVDKYIAEEEAKKRRDLKSEHLAGEARDEVVGKVGGERSIASGFQAQIQHEMEPIPRPRCGLCYHPYEFHVEKGVVGDCRGVFRDLTGMNTKCQCLMYEPKSYDKEPIQPLPGPSEADPLNDLLNALRGIIHDYDMDMPESVDFVRQFAALYVDAFSVPERVRFWNRWKQR